MNEQLKKAIEDATRVGHYSFDFGPMVLADQHHASQAKLLRVIELLVAQRNFYCDMANMPDKSYQEHIEDSDAELIAALEGEK